MKKARLPLDAPPKQGARQYGAPPSKPVPAVVVEQSPGEKPKRQKQPKPKADPKLIAAARELRDRWLERVNDDPSLIGSGIGSNGKYDIARALTTDASSSGSAGAITPLLPSPLAA
jgi:hypothetical protein